MSNLSYLLPGAESPFSSQPEMFVVRVVCGEDEFEVNFYDSSDRIEATESAKGLSYLLNCRLADIEFEDDFGETLIDIIKFIKRRPFVVQVVDYHNDKQPVYTVERFKG